jgi:hypothetical protein
MGRDKNRMTTKLPFKGKAIEMYRPTDGQAAAMFMSAKKNGDTAVSTFFRVLEKLVVKPADWTYMEDLMIDGTAVVSDFSELFKNLYGYDWPEDAPTDGE